MRSFILRVVAVAIATTGLTAPLTGCAPQENPEVSAGAIDFAAVQLNLSAVDAERVRRIALSFNPVDGLVPVFDEFDLQGSGEFVSRNYRMPLGEYDVVAEGFDENGDLILVGGTEGAVLQPGNNDISILLRDPVENLSDVYVTLDSPTVGIGFVAVDGDVEQGGIARVHVTGNFVSEDEPENEITLRGTLYSVTSVEDDETVIHTFEVSGDGLDFFVDVPVEFLGEARLELQLMEGNAVADETNKVIIGRPSALTRSMIAALADELSQDEQGLYLPIERLVTVEGAELSPDGLDQLNLGIENFNLLILEAGPIPAIEISTSLIYAATLSWYCAGKVGKCYIFSAGCLAAVPAAVVGCGPVCAATIGLGCVACITVAVASTVAVCELAADCWADADEKGCL